MVHLAIFAEKIIMADITLKGNPFHTVGELPKVGSMAPNFKLVKDDLSEKTLADYKILVTDITYKINITDNFLRNKEWKRTNVVTNIELYLEGLIDAYFTFYDMLYSLWLDDKLIAFIYSKKHEVDQTGNSMNFSTEFTFKDGARIVIACTDWGKELEDEGYVDNLDVGIASSEFYKWMVNEAYQ